MPFCLTTNALIDVIEILSVNDFYKSAHQIIFSAIETLYSKSEPVDLVTLANSLQEMGSLEKIGGAAYLARLVDTVPMAVNARHYARIVHDKAVLRRLIEQSNAITRQCFEDSGNVDGIIEFAQSAVFEISQGKASQAFAPISTIIESNIDALEERQGNRSLVTGVTTGFFKTGHTYIGLSELRPDYPGRPPGHGKNSLCP